MRSKQDQRQAERTFAPNVSITSTDVQPGTIGPTYQGHNIWHLPWSGASGEVPVVEVFDPGGRLVISGIRQTWGVIRVDLAGAGKGIFVARVTAPSGTPLVYKLFNP